MPFHWYANQFLKITMKISRQQELMADQLAVEKIGAEPFVDGLKKIHAYGPAFHAYVQNEYSPPLSAGFRPPFIEGFTLFSQSETVTKKMMQIIDSEVTPVTLPDLLDQPSKLVERIRQRSHKPLENNEMSQSILTIATSALAVALHHNGWKVSALPGEQVTFFKDEYAIQPFEVVPEIATSKLAREEWRKRCLAMQIENISLNSN